jgi:site-specific DNA-methyltransferase (adenine-specific)
MPRRSHIPSPHAVVDTGRSTLTFYRGDAVALLPRVVSRPIDVVVTSPPYNLGIRYRTYKDTLPRDEYLAWTRRWVRTVARKLAADGSLFLNVGARPKDPWAALDVAQAARRCLTLQNTIHWIKSIAIDRAAVGDGSRLPRDLAVGHYKPINSRRFINDCHEFIFHFTHAGTTHVDREAVGVAYQDKSNVTRWRAAARDRRCRGNAWFIPYDTIKDRARDRPHPATFPPRLPEQCLRLHGLSRTTLVVDPFVGLGSTAVACAKLGIDFVGIDLDEVYLEQAAERARHAGAHLPLSDR